MTAAVGPHDPAQTVSLCIPTYRRPGRLEEMLADIAAQTRLPDEIVVVDNDAAGTARDVVAAFAQRHQGRIAVQYAIQPEKNIALTRNMTLDLAAGPWLGFIDDDERAPATWLEALLDCARTSGADGVLAPVVPIVPADAPEWIRRGRLYESPRMPTGSVVPINVVRIGNALLHRSMLNLDDRAFDPAFGVTGGSDSELLMRLVQKGARLVWCDEAAVSEPVEAKRLSLQWILRRALRGGQDYTRHFLAGRVTGAVPGIARRLVFFARAFAQMLAAGLLSVGTLPAGRHHAAYWLAKTWANFGKLAVLSGWLYQEYAQERAC